MQKEIQAKRMSSVTLFFLCICHSLVLARQAQSVTNKNYRNNILQKIDSLLERKYVFPDKAKQSAEAFYRAWNSGSYDPFSDAEAFAEKVTAELRDITRDKHIQFRVIKSSAMGEKPESALRHPLRYYRLRIKENTGFSKLEWLEGNIGYLDLRRFNHISEAREMLLAAMQFLSNANAIIIDLRENGGGSGDYLSSCFLKHPTQLNGDYSREDNFLTECWTSGNIGVKHLTEVPLFLLTSERTFSAAESFAYDMKVRGRATLIGDSTKGGAHSVDLFRIDEQFEIYIPTSRAVNPVTGGNWEGEGVIPDVVVPSTAALDTAIVLARKAAETYGSLKETKIKSAVDEMQTHLEHAETLYRKDEGQSAKAALDSVFFIGKEMGFISEFFLNVLAYEYASKEDEQICYAILKKSTEYFHDSPTAYETLAYVYFSNGEREQAIENYKKVLELEPDNRNAMKMIKRIQGPSQP